MILISKLLLTKDNYVRNYTLNVDTSEIRVIILWRGKGGWKDLGLIEMKISRGKTGISRNC